MKKIELTFDENEIKYLISCGFALLQNIPDDSLPTYCFFNKQQILDFTMKMRELAEKNDIEI